MLKRPDVWALDIAYDRERYSLYLLLEATERPQGNLRCGEPQDRPADSSEEKD